MISPNSNCLNQGSVPFEVFHEAIEKALGRPVWTHEFGLNMEGLKKEFLGETPPPTMEEIMNLIPEEKRVIIEVPEDPPIPEAGPERP
jgi:hypothetical protein